MKITKRQLRQIIRESMMPPGAPKKAAAKKASAPLESLFVMGAPYDNTATFSDSLQALVEKTPGLNQKLREILGPMPNKKSSNRYMEDVFYVYFANHMDAASRDWPRKRSFYADHWILGSPEWVNYASNLIRQLGIEAEFINHNPADNDIVRDGRDPGGWTEEERAGESSRQPGDPVPVDTNTGTDLTVDAMGADDAVDSVSGNVTDPVFLRQLAGWLQQMDKNPAVQMIMYNLD